MEQLLITMRVFETEISQETYDLIKETKYYQDNVRRFGDIADEEQIVDLVMSELEILIESYPQDIDKSVSIKLLINLNLVASQKELDELIEISYHKAFLEEVELMSGYGYIDDL